MQNDQNLKLNLYNQAIYIPERDRWISVLELNENEKYREFFHNLLMLYEAVCAQSNNYVAHQLCNQIDEKQLMYCIQNSYLNGHIRRRFYDLLIKLHLESFAVSRQMTKYEFVIPLNSKLFSNKLVDHKELMKNGKLPKHDDFVSVRPSIISESQIKNETQKLYLVPPSFNIEALKQFVLNSFPDSVKLCISHVRDPTGGSNSFLFVPLIKLLNQLLVMDVFSEDDLHLLMAYLDPKKFTSESVSIPEGLLSANLEDEIKYEICLFLHSLCDYVLRFRVEAVVSFSSNYVNEIQCDQKKRYNELKESSLPSALMAKKTKEFRCPAKDQMQSLVNFKSSSHHLDLSEDIKNKLTDFHLSLNQICQIKQRDEQKVSDNQVDSSGFVSKIVKVLFSSDYSAIAENQEQMEPTQENLIAICEEVSQDENSHKLVSNK
ncbi:ryanodine receptor-like isoform X13 [Brachionus plicatilis]|uniref:Ryanodine receptor-like isoform X13 n=1 Tax=Brachionus plicatilis TaxID=10195 RepID=A0A3M7R1S3_BRAPC|nr:ryanodine receptor-like isoform X13 [Brachionus plicatilis]